MARVKKVTPLTLLNPKAYSSDEQMMVDRWRQCRSCPDIRHGICSHCGCFMKAKVKLRAASCPLGKWLAEPESAS